MGKRRDLSNIKNHRKKILLSLLEKLKDKFPNAYFHHSYKENDDRIIIPWDGSDSFIFYFSDQEFDAFRMGFVIDLDIKDSMRRKAYEEYISNYVKEIENSLGTKVFSAHKISGIRNISDENIVNQGIKEWVKISAHRRKGVYKMIIIDEYSDQDLVELLYSEIVNFTDNLKTILVKYRPRK